jgi:hypothetical protein
MLVTAISSLVGPHTALKAGCGCILPCGSNHKWPIESPYRSAAEFYRNLFAGAAASFVSQFVIVPVDVVAQRLMVQGPEGKKDFPHGLGIPLPPAVYSLLC